MGAGDVKRWRRWVLWWAWRTGSVFIATALINGIMALILVATRGRVKHTLFNVGFILDEMKHGRPAYLANEELDVRNKKALGLPHGAVIAVGTLFFLALSAYFTR
jgi:Flp pilus assembly protein protease CpaA